MCLVVGIGIVQLQDALYKGILYPIFQHLLKLCSECTHMNLHAHSLQQTATHTSVQTHVCTHALTHTHTHTHTHTRTHQGTGCPAAQPTAQAAGAHTTQPSPRTGAASCLLPCHHHSAYRCRCPPLLPPNPPHTHPQASIVNDHVRN